MHKMNSIFFNAFALALLMLIKIRKFLKINANPMLNLSNLIQNMNSSFALISS